MLDEPSSGDSRDRVASILKEIEFEMKRIGYWSTQPLPKKSYQFQEAFAMDTMSFAQWLQFVLIPHVHEILDTKGDFPERSRVGTQAIREFDGDEMASRLVQLLNEFDLLFNEG